MSNTHYSKDPMKRRGKPGMFRITRRLEHGRLRVKVRNALNVLDEEKATERWPRHSSLWALW